MLFSLVIGIFQVPVCISAVMSSMQCAGILIDMPTYGLELLKKDFQDVANWRAVPGAILVNLKDNNG